MGLQLPEIGDVTDVIPQPVTIDIRKLEGGIGRFVDQGDRFKYGDAVRATAAQIVHLARPRVPGERVERLNHVSTVDVVAYLLALDRKSTRLNSSHLGTS